jgi:hypothetical protein
MHTTMRLAVATAVLWTATCSKSQGALETGPGSGSAAAPAGSAIPSTGKPAAPVPEPAAPIPTTLAATALDDALRAKGIAAASVAIRADKPRSQWAAVKGKLDPTTAAVTAYTIWRVTSAGPATVELVPPASPDGSLFDDLAAFDVKDLEGDGIDDALLIATWSRQFTEKSKPGDLTSTEHIQALYAFGGARLAIGAQHAIRYTTATNLGPGEDPQPEESIVFTYKLVPGSPPVLQFGVADSTVSPMRVKGLLDPKRDPWLAPGDLPIVFK